MTCFTVMEQKMNYSAGGKTVSGLIYPVVSLRGPWGRRRPSRALQIQSIEFSLSTTAASIRVLPDPLAGYATYPSI